MTVPGPGAAAADPAAAYRGREGHWRAEVARLERRFNALSVGRGVLFVTGVGVAWTALAQGRLSLWWAAVPLALFLVLALQHQRVAGARDRARRALEYYQRGLARLSGAWAGQGDGGDRFRPAHHCYADDLDLFGRGGVFELLCTCRTAPGEATLAQWLLHPAPPELVRARQAAVQELARHLTLREDLAVEGATVGERLDRDALARWAGQDPALPRWFAPVAFALGLSNVLALLGAAWFGISALVPLGSLLVSAAVALAVRARTASIVANADRAARQLDLVAGLLRRIEAETFQAPLLVAMARRMGPTDGERASRRIGQLDRLIGLLDSRRNQLFLPIAAVLLWTTQLSGALDRWRRASGPQLADWVDAVGAFEALAALATSAFEHPDRVFPEMLDGLAQFEARDLAHPLLPRGPAIPNDVGLTDARRLLLVSGSNMSGKSTLLRAIGVNAVLAQAGAPVCATQLRMSPLAIGASFRAIDSLQEGQSRFYAEIARLRQVMDLLAGPMPVLFLLDELLSGTNSHDRAIGARAVVRHLVEAGAIGLITTHDLALAAIADDLAPRAANVHFEDHLEAGRLVFDYRLRPGVVTRSNALELMRSVGLDV